MMEGPTSRPTVEYIPPLPTKQRNSTTFTQITNETLNGFDATDGRSSIDSLSSMHSLILNSKSSSATVFIAANQSDRPASTPSPDAPVNGPHVVTIRINTDSDKSKAPKISSVHLKSDIDFETFKLHERKNNSLVRINVDETRPKILENEDTTKVDKAPYIYCNSYVNSMTNMVMSSGQCSPSDTLDSGTCSDLDGTPPPLPKKKSVKNSSKKAVSVTVISSRNGSSQSEVDFEDNDSNISCDSLNSSELNGSVHADESHIDYAMKKENKPTVDPPIAPEMPSYTKTTKDNTFLPIGLLQDIRDRSAKLNTIETESEVNQDTDQNINENANISKESAQLTSFRLVSQLNGGAKKNDDHESLPANSSKTPLISESTYEERKNQDKLKHEKICYSSHYFDTDKFYDFHLNEKQFDEKPPVKSVSVSGKSDCDGSEVEFFAGIKDYKAEEAPSTIRSSKGTIRGVKNRVRAGIATFLQMQSTTKSYKEKDAGKVVVYTTTMGIVRSTYQRCVLVKKILRNLLVKYEERDVFMSTEYQDEIRDRMRSDQILVPQLFVEGHHIGDADTVEKLNESGELRKMLKPYKSPDACNTCQICGGFRLLPCRICNGSKKSLHRNHFTAEFVALKCMNCDEVGLVRCDACS
ncbi:glutaredoxin domain-containing cysteine-rich protein CG31559-like [Plodia interpunctella]|uniref:glutaredoxin domain-containing cysteine-rich protein CG31559-like n=1 Tax=Plodia interpunctella TaxID=58824 RepID=UPI00236775A6|nr:glutaredoxin domain-containing cysteine-rich protein CG31559-like [Plodia interpunctella]XP_053616111.1 glutaredoxin domain-containing cysteine-rich protein CG31559-like [Plodia interpunctella]